MAAGEDAAAEWLDDAASACVELLSDEGEWLRYPWGSISDGLINLIEHTRNIGSTLFLVLLLSLEELLWRPLCN